MAVPGTRARATRNRHLDRRLWGVWYGTTARFLMFGGRAGKAVWYGTTPDLPSDFGDPAHVAAGWVRGAG